MGLYSQPPLELLCRLIMRDNPQLAIPLDPTKVMVLSGPLTTGLGTSGRNARITLNGTTGSGIVGKKEFFYDRLRLNTLFAQTTTLVLTMPNEVKTVKDLLPTINDALGLNLTAVDITTADTALGLGRLPTSQTITASAASLCFTGAFTFQWQRGTAGYYPGTGPGSQYMLSGDMTMGYFGQVTLEEMYDGVALVSDLYDGQIPTGVSGLTDANQYWLKFALDNEIVFFPSSSVASGLTWNALNALGAVYGNRKDPIVMLGEKNYFFTPRLAKMSQVDPVDPIRADPTSDAARLFNKVQAVRNGTGEWDELTTLDLTGVFWWMNTRLGYEDNAYNTSMSRVSINTPVKTTASYWRPVLVLRDATTMLAKVRNLHAEIVRTVDPIPMTVSKTRDPNILIAVKDINGTLLRSIKPIRNAVPISVPLLAVGNLVAQGNALPSGQVLKPITAKISTIVRTKTVLDALNGELDGF